MILCEENNVKLEVIDEGIVRKTFKYDISNIYDFKWLARYNKLRELDPRYIEVYGVGPNYIDMKYIENYITMSEFITDRINISDENKKYSIDARINLVFEYIDIIFKTQGYLNSKDKIFVHTDLKPNNILISDYKLVIIDPDSCRYNPELHKLYGDSVSDIVKILNKYYSLLRRKQNSQLKRKNNEI
jgi:serine/threonine protein kinase